jgi:rhamnogalacturonyl hydrolase YesR
MEKKDAIQTKDLLRNYDALQDKHASFYFNGYGVKKHLRKLKKVYSHLLRPSKWSRPVGTTSNTLPSWLRRLARLMKRPRMLNITYNLTNNR